MESPIHNLSSLFDQLGLQSGENEIVKFITKNKPLPSNMKLHKAEMWNASQASFLRQVKEQDADWVEIVDQLDAMLR